MSEGNLQYGIVGNVSHYSDEYEYEMAIFHIVMRIFYVFYFRSDVMTTELTNGGKHILNCRKRSFPWCAV